MTDRLNIHPADIDVLREKERVIELLGIPITSLSFSNFFCELFVNSQSIGYLQFDRTSMGNQYNTSKEALKKINWKQLCVYFSKELNSLIQAEVKLSSFRVVAVSFRRLYIEDEHGNLIASFWCTYRDSRWSIEDEKVLASNSKNTP